MPLAEEVESGKFSRGGGEKWWVTAQLPCMVRLEKPIFPQQQYYLGGRTTATGRSEEKGKKVHKTIKGH